MCPTQIFLRKEFSTTVQGNMTLKCAPCIYRGDEQDEIQLYSMTSRSFPKNCASILFLTTSEVMQYPLLKSTL